MEKEQLFEMAKQTSSDWKKLRAQLMDENKFDCKLFKKVFSKTYYVLSNGVATQPSVEKQYMSMIMNACVFSKMSVQTDNIELESALILTERMIQKCVAEYNDVEETGGTTMYNVKKKEEVYVGFENVEKAMQIVADIVAR